MNYGKQSISNDDIAAVTKILKSPYLTTGPSVKQFEEEFALKVGAKYAVAVANGTAALHIASLAANLTSGQELITSPLTFVASANCAFYCGAKPIFADIKPNGLIDPNSIQKKITKNTKIIIPVHYAGYPCDMENISKLAKENNLIVIEDACHALGARYKDSKIGDCQYSDMTVFSFHPVKQITTGEGGMVTTNSEKLYNKLLNLRTHGITKNKEEFKYTSDGPWYYEMQTLGYNYRITDFQCALGSNQLKRVDKFVSKRIELAKRYDEAFKNNQNIETLPEEKNTKSSYIYSDADIQFCLFV